MAEAAEKPAKKKQRHFRKADLEKHPHAKTLNSLIRSNAYGKDKRVVLHYTKADGSKVKREVTPLGARNNILYAHDHHRDATRSFRLDRMNTIDWQKPQSLAKQAALKSTLKPHQERVVQRIQQEDQPGLVVAHGLGSGKTLTSIAAQAALDVPGVAVVPASLQENYSKEIRKHLKGKPNIKVKSMQGTVAKGESLDSPFLVVDEAHRGRDPKSKTRKALGEAQAAKRMLLTASPMYNHPSDIAPLINIAAGTKVLPEGKAEFEKGYIMQKQVKPSFFNRLRGMKPGVTPVLDPSKRKEVSQAFSKWVDYHPGSEEGFPDRVDETVKVQMTPKQLKMYDTIIDEAPAWVKMKIKAGMPPSKTEARQLNAFMTGARQVSLSTAPYQKNEGPYEAPKIDRAFEELKQDLASNKRHKSLIYSSYLGAGLKPYEERLQAAGIPYGRFTGDMKKKDRDQEVRDFNAGKKRVMFVSRAGGEGLDLKGTRTVQVLEPHWNEEAIKQVVGRAIRYKSHDHLPENERNVKVQRFVATRSPKGLLERYGGKKPGLAADEYLMRMSQTKEELNKQFQDVLAKKAQLLNDRPEEIEAASPGASLALSSRAGVGENIPSSVKAQRKSESKGLRKFRRHSAAAGQETKVIPHSVYDGDRQKKRFSPSEFYSPHSN